MKAIIPYFLLLVLCPGFGAGIAAQIPKLNSYPSAAPAVYLDFDGQYVAGTSWNWSGPITAEPAGLTGEAITEIFNRVAEDFRPFNINVTTDSSVYLSAPYNNRTRVIITPTSSWYGRSGGVAFVTSFHWGDETPAWVFSALLGNNTKYVAEACSHEIGHTLGLQHMSIYDGGCNKTAEYSGGQGEGETGWAPIMGVGYYKNLTTWHVGASSAGCSTIQNDLSVIADTAQGIYFRPDDHGNNPATATAVAMQGGSFLVNGLIGRPEDADVFSIDLQAQTNIKLNAVPMHVGSGNQGANVDIKVALLNAQQDTVGIYNPAMLLDAGIDTLLNKGRYYVVVKGAGNVYRADYGSYGFYSITGSAAITLPIHQITLKGTAINDGYFLSWKWIGDEPVKSFIVEASADGKSFDSLLSVHAETSSLMYKPVSRSNYYRLKLVTYSGGSPYYSNIVSMTKTNGLRSVRLLSTVVSSSIKISCSGVYAYQLFDATGRLMAKGNIANGLNTIDAGTLSKGLLMMRIYDGVNQWTEKIIKQ